MSAQLVLGRNLRWVMASLVVSGAALMVTAAALPNVMGLNLWQTLAHVRAVDAVLMMGGFDHAVVPFLIVGGIGLLTLLTLAILTPLALGFLVLDIHMELQQVCDVQGRVMHTERRLFCKLRRPVSAKNTPPVIEDTPTRALAPQARL